MNFQPYPFAMRRAVRDLPPELRILRGQVDDVVLRRKAHAAAEGPFGYRCPIAALIAEGYIGERAYYRTLAAHLGLPFREDWPMLAPPVAHGKERFASAVRLDSDDRGTWLLAPEGRMIRRLLAAPGAARDRFSLTTPSHCAALVQVRRQAAIEHTACDALPHHAPRWSARRLAGPRFKIAAASALISAAAAWIVVPSLAASLLGIVFLAGLLFKIAICAAALRPEPPGASLSLSDDELPVYTVLVPLRDETEVVAQLLEALARLDYPKDKLDVLLLIEPEDRATRAALAACRLPPWLRVVFGPVGGTLRTKPRALNIGLLAARGTLLTVFDAEDRPERGQLRAAAARFAEAPASLACLQAALAIDNGDDGILPRCFAIEYAVLFDLLNVGLTRLGLPVALGGTSNHFRVASLKAAGGWDAWNVTEDADLGLRLARLGYQVDSLASTTWEAAPKPLAVWMKQRRRWSKGWIQTLLVLLGDGPAVCRALGARRTVALILCFTNLLLGPLLYPLVGAGYLMHALALSRGHVGQGDSLPLSYLFAAVLALGALSTFWCGEKALTRRPSAGDWPALLLLPVHQMLVGLACWISLVDLWRAPFVWHKTAHPRSTSRGRAGRRVPAPVRTLVAAALLRPRLSIRHRS